MRRTDRGSATRTLLATVVVVAAVVGIGLVIKVAWQRFADHTLASTCTYGPAQIGTDQASVASTMVGVVHRRELPERAAILTLAAGLQESKLRNIPAGQGDRDSVGVLQQRPSQGWGSATQLSDVHYATGRFLSALVKVHDWQTLPLATAIQDVQRSADGSAYAKHEAVATAVADGLWGGYRGVSCHFAKPDTVAPAATVAAQLRRDLPVRVPSVSGRTLRVPGAGWATAAWLISNGDRLGVDTVGYDGQRWTRAHGWKADKLSDSTAVVATMATAGG